MYFVIGKDNCPWCDKAKELLEKNETPYVYKNLSQLSDAKKELWIEVVKEELATTTVPAIFNFVGGYSELEGLLDD